MKAPPVRLTLEQIEAGCKSALKNAEELVEDALVLLDAGRWARCYFLSEIATEELGKYAMLVGAGILLRTTDLLDSDEAWKRLWDGLSNHRRKFWAITAVEDLKLGADLTDGDRRRIEAGEENAVKMQALYSDLYGDEFLRPSEIVAEPEAATVLALVADRLEEQKDFERRLRNMGGIAGADEDLLREGLERSNPEIFAEAEGEAEGPG